MAAVPAHFAVVEIVARDVLGAVAHRWVCRVPGCTSPSGTPLDAKADGSPDGRVLAGAQRHADAHTRAQDAIDDAQEGR